MDQNHPSTFSVRRVTRAQCQQFDEISRYCFGENKNFWSHPSTYLWSAKEDRAFVIGYFDNERLISYVVLEIFGSPNEFESRLVGMKHGVNSPAYVYPVLYLSRSATAPEFQRRGLSRSLRKIAISLGQSVQVSNCISSVIEDSESMNLLKGMGAHFFENPRKWASHQYRSSKRPFLASLDLKNLEFEAEVEIVANLMKSDFADWFEQFQFKKIELVCEYTKFNHFRFGFNASEFSLERSPQDSFFARYGECRRITYDFRTECTLAAHEIYQRSQGRPIYICFSGGIDSEIICETFRFARIPHRIIIARINNDLNVHDYSWAISYCEKNRLSYEFYDFDFVSFINSIEYKELIERVQCRYPMLTLTMKLMEYVIIQKNGLPILGSGECWVNKVRGRWYLVEPEPIQALYRFLIYNQFLGVPGFFQWSPELMNSYILDPSIQALIRNQHSGVVSSAEIKPEVYSHYFSFEKRPKFRGFEKFRDLMREKLEEAHVLLGGTSPKQNELDVHALLERWNRPYLLAHSPKKKAI